MARHPVVPRRSMVRAIRPSVPSTDAVGDDRSTSTPAVREAHGSIVSTPKTARSPKALPNILFALGGGGASQATRGKRSRRRKREGASWPRSEVRMRPSKRPFARCSRCMIAESHCGRHEGEGSPHLAGVAGVLRARRLKRGGTGRRRDAFATSEPKSRAVMGSGTQGAPSESVW